MAHTDFFGMSLVTAPGRVMTPRCASEALVATALERVAGRSAARVADVGTGSGALAIAIASQVPDAAVWATDTSGCAVTLARANVARHGLDERVALLQSALLDDVPAPLDLVVANLPYLPAAQAALRPELAGEPATAVFAEGDGLGPYRSLLTACRDHLAPDGAVVLQLHRAVFAAPRADLVGLRARIEAHAAAQARGAAPIAA